MVQLPRIIPLNTFPGFLGRWNKWTNLCSRQMGYQQQADWRRILPKSSSWNSEFNWANLGVTTPTKKGHSSAVCEHPVKVITASLTSKPTAGRPCPQDNILQHQGFQRLPCFSACTLSCHSVVKWILSSTFSYYDQLKLKVARAVW